MPHIDWIDWLTIYKKNYMQQKTWEDLKVGDSVWDSQGKEHKLNAKIELFTLSNNGSFTVEEFNAWGYSLTPPSPKITLTKQQIADKFGVDISNLIIE